jgi:hypothetical protein
MEFTTKVKIEKSFRIAHNDSVMFTGSCFAAEIGSVLREGKMPVMINPAGTVFNPFSVADTLDNVIRGEKKGVADLFSYNGTWMSLSHYTDFSGTDKEALLEKINARTAVSNEFLKKAKALFITFGTARVFRMRENSRIVSNCHKLPNELFTRELLSVDSIVTLWSGMLDRLAAFNPGLKVVFTISPVRHWKDGAHGNQVSKSVLFIATEELLKHRTQPGYFPAFEILLDELRDYRFYADDMLHPSDAAVKYIWECFSECYLGKPAMDTWKEAAGITAAFRHRITGSGKKVHDFAENMLSRIERLEASVPGIDFAEEKKYFRSLL